MPGAGRLLAALVLLMPLAAAGCGSPRSAAAASGQRRVVAALYPLAFAAQAVAPPGVRVVDLVPAGAEPHDFELAPDDVRAILEADLVIYAAGFQPAVDRVIAGREGRSLEVLGIPGLGLRSMRDGHQHGHRHPAVDPHLWLDPALYAAAARAIASELGSRAELSAFEARLAELDRELAAGLEGCRRRELVTSHDAFGYLADRYGLEQIPLSGPDPEAEPAPRDLERLVRRARSVSARVVFTEPLAPAAVADALAGALGARTLSLNPIEGLTEEEAGRGEDYFSLMRANLAALREGLDCPPLPS